MKRTWSNPEGLVSGKPIAMRLMPTELADAERIAPEFGVEAVEKPVSRFVST